MLSTATPRRLAGMTVIMLFAAAYLAGDALAQVARDPGLRGGPAGAGGPLAGLGTTELQFQAAAANRFQEVDSVSGTIESGVGLGPRFNGNSCAMCHVQPAIGGTSPFINPQIAVANLDGATNPEPLPFITQTGPVREVRFKSDGGVHDLFTIAGRTDARGCVAAQPDFSNMSNLSFRIPTPTFGLGLVENIPDATLEADAAAVAGQFGISGHFNHKKGGLDSDFNASGNTGTITRFGWKAQNPSLLVFAQEAYLVEQGVTNEGFTVERDVSDTSGCLYDAEPKDSTNLVRSINSGSPASDYASDVVNFAVFMRLSEPPVPAPATQSTINGGTLFKQVGCAACHIPSHTTTASIFTNQSYRTIFPYSDFQVHNLGDANADGITQGDANGNEFRTAPLWGVGQRIFFFHDGRFTDLLQAIQAHDPGPGNSQHSEAHQVIGNFNNLTASQQQDILNFLRAL